MRRDGDHADLAAAEGAHLLELVDESAVVKVLGVGGEFQQTHPADGSDVEQPVVRHGIAHHLHAATVVLAVADGEAEDGVVEHQPVVDKDLDGLAFVGHETVDQADQITHRAPLALRFHLVGLVAHHLVEPRAGSIQEIPHFGITVVVIGHLADIVAEKMPLPKHLHQVRITLGKGKSPGPVVARADGEDPHGNLCGRKPLLGENAINDLVIGAIATYGDDLLIAFLGDQVPHQINGMAVMPGQHKVEIKPCGREQILHDRPIPAAFPDGRHRVHHHQPFAIFFVH